MSSPVLPTHTRERRRPGTSHAANPGRGFVVKLALVALVDALGLYIVLNAWTVQSFGVMWGMVALLVAVNWVYFSRRALPMKYLLPGLAFLAVFQIFTILYTGYIAFTNYGQGHNSTKADAVEALLVQSEQRVAGSRPLPLAVVESTGVDLLGEGGLGFAVVEDGAVLVGTGEAPLAAVDGAEVSDGRITAVPGWEVLDRQEVLQRQEDVVSLRVPYSEDPADGSVRTQDARTGYLYRSSLVYDEDADTMTNRETGVVYTATDDGRFAAPDGSTLPVGWRVVVGWDNFATAFSDARYAQPFLSVLVWTFAFAFLSVALTFFFGFFLATVFNDPRVRGRTVIRSLLLLPYAFPSFMSFLLWRGLLNREYGFINQVLLGGAEIPWLTDEWLARIAVLGVQLWVGFPYMFIICTGALQSIPSDVYEAARIDGAGPLRVWRSITLPLLLVAVTPLLISSFAFNFNNFNVIEMVTEGGPRFPDASVPIGATDILITMVYSISGLDGGAPTNYGLASALSLVIFLIVAVVSIISFKRSQSFQEIS